MIRAYVERLLDLTDSEWIRYVYSKELLRDKIPEQDKPVMAQKARECGREKARMIKERYPGESAAEIMRKLGVSLQSIKPEKGKLDRNFFLYASFTPPSQISIDEAGAARAQELIASNSLTELLGKVDVREVMLFHELFHFLELNDGGIYTKKLRIPLWKLFSYTYTSTVGILSEFASMEFARELTRLEFELFLLDPVLMYAMDERAGVRLFERMLQMKK